MHIGMPTLAYSRALISDIASREQTTATTLVCVCVCVCRISPNGLSDDDQKRPGSKLSRNATSTEIGPGARSPTEKLHTLNFTVSVHAVTLCLTVFLTLPGPSGPSQGILQPAQRRFSVCCSCRRTPSPLLLLLHYIWGLSTYRLE
jgi:hypothetical protein